MQAENLKEVWPGVNVSFPFICIRENLFLQYYINGKSSGEYLIVHVGAGGEESMARQWKCKIVSEGASLPASDLLDEGGSV